MPVSNPAIVALNGGEWSPRLYGRYDQDKYLTSMRLCQNFLPLSHGPAIRRPGTRFVSWVRQNEADTRIFPFVYDQDQAYVLEFSHKSGGSKKVRFYRNRSAVTETAKNITAITKANPGVVTSNSHGFSTNDEVFITGVGGMTELNGKRFSVGATTSNTFELKDPIDQTNVVTTGYGTYTSGGTAARIYEVTHPYSDSDLPSLKMAQALDVAWFFCPGYAPRKLTRTSDTSWAFSTYDTVFGPFLPENHTQNLITSRTYTPGTVGSTGNLVFTNTSNINGGAGFTSSDIGRQIMVTSYIVLSGSEVGREYRNEVVEITGINTTSSVAVSVRRAGSGSLAYSGRAWRLDYWSDNLGWPTCGTFYKGRLWTANSASYPENVWASEAGIFDSFNPVEPESAQIDLLPRVLPTHAIALNAGDDRAALVHWLSPALCASIRLPLGARPGPLHWRSVPPSACLPAQSDWSGRNPRSPAGNRPCPVLIWPAAASHSRAPGRSFSDAAHP